jgi:prepilin-type N-terminal cleavage/methylation domain-containing protein
MGCNPVNNRHGYTLVEILVVIGIVALLASLVFAAFNPVRAKSRESVCLSNLHQWGKAFSMYISDYDGADAVIGTPMTHAQLGLPDERAGEVFMKTYKLWDSPVDRCPSSRRTIGPKKKVPMVSYWAAGFASERFNEDLPSVVARRGMDYPLMICDQHNENVEWLTLPTWATKRVVVLRLSQQVSDKKVSAKELDAYKW